MTEGIAMLFAAHRDRDALRIDAAMRHLESLDWRERMANNLCSGEPSLGVAHQKPRGTSPRVQNPAVVRKDAAPKGGENQLGQSDDPLHITEAEAIAVLAPEWPDVAEIAR